MSVVNLFAMRASDPRHMLKASESVGVGNNEAIVEEATTASLVVAAWGVHGGHQGRAACVLRILQEFGPVWALDFTADGHPRHPLMTPYSAKLERVWSL